VSVVLTLFIVPAAYYMLYRWQEARTAVRSSRAMAEGAPQPAA
jgi:hypothetical protein